MIANKLNVVNNSRIKLTLILILISMLILLFVRTNNKPILIGFSAQLTGRQAELGVQERNGVQLAVEKINGSGGISGRKVELVIRDDFGVPEKAKFADDELIKVGVIAIIGHATSSQTLEGLKVTNPAKVVMIGSTVSTPELSSLDDYFFRVYPSFKDSAQAFARYIYNHNSIKRISVIYDMDNYAYSKNYSKDFEDKFKSLGGSVGDEVSFSSVTQPDFSTLLIRLREGKAEGLLIVASDIDTAFIAQRSRIIGWQVPLFTSSWAPTENLINNGGEAVEGMKFEQAYGWLIKQPKEFNNFQAGYQARFGNKPSFGSALAYDATMVLADALRKTGGKSEGLKQELLKIRDFPGVLGPFSFDKFGDVKRPCYIGDIHNHDFINLDKLILNDSRGE
ncbi:ABC transporter substrate-binding protein [Clostridium sp. PL3]|uniref:ABC transporter substrate-binding protein n=1 Tax=Clostridium thailandense TaxID=2794346 RepID=A0A949WXR2_9CLOT|nr:ABC transporter substrate-binding protein [Clostridium thailandense]MBV7276247.1 ABC transporter substrate-binding protein [Clostridium thailandense]